MELYEISDAYYGVWVRLQCCLKLCFYCGRLLHVVFSCEPYFVIVRGRMKITEQVTFFNIHISPVCLVVVY